jgi:hypothetical protein
MNRGPFSEAGRARRRRFLSRVHIALAAVGTLGACLGIAIAIDGGLEFNRAKLSIYGRRADRGRDDPLCGDAVRRRRAFLKRLGRTPHHARTRNLYRLSENHCG